MFLRKLTYYEFIALLKRRNRIRAIWRNKDFDTPVVVNGYYGVGSDGSTHYVKIDGSNSGIPLSELLFQ